MKNTLFFCSLLLLFASCKKNDTAKRTAALTDKIKTMQIVSTDSTYPQANGTINCHFTYNSDGLVDTMQLSSDSGVFNTMVYERYPTYFIRHWYNGPTLIPDYLRDSFVTDANGRILERYMHADTGGQIFYQVKTTFTYNNGELSAWSEAYTGPIIMTLNNSITWSGGNIVSMTGDGNAGSLITPYPAGTYTYNPSIPGQPAHPLTLYALYEWGQPSLLQSVAHATAQEIPPGISTRKNILMNGSRISSYEDVTIGVKVRRYSFTYY